MADLSKDKRKVKLNQKSEDIKLSAPSDSDAGLGTSVDEEKQALTSDESSNTSLAEINDQYELIKSIGKGGMGEVFLANEKNTSKQFAIKILHSDLSEDAAALKRFEQEIETASRLNHANLVSIYDHGKTFDGSPFLVMDYIQGTTLSEWLQENNDLSTLDAINFFIQICEGLKEAHSKGVLHRDLKPSNILIQHGEGQLPVIKLADFGIARIANESVNYTQTLTETSEVVGSPKYMSPEQCLGITMDEKSDIYSLGCLMYEVLEKRPPFEGGNAIQIILKQISELPPKFKAEAKAKDPQIRELEKVIFKCLSKETGSRYESVSVLLDDLETIKSGGKFKIRFKDYARELFFTILLIVILAAVTAYNVNYKKARQTATTTTTTTTQSAAPAPVSAWQNKTEDEIASEMQFQAFKHFKARSYRQAIPALKYVAETYKKSGQRFNELFAYQCLGQCYLSLKEYKQAEPWYEKAVNGMKDSYGDNVQKGYAEAASGYVEVLERLGKKEEAMVWLRKIHKPDLIWLHDFYSRSGLTEDANRVQSQIDRLNKMVDSN